MSHLIELKNKDNDTSAVIEDIYVTELDNKDNECVRVYRVLEKSRNGRIFHKLCTLERNISDKSCMA